MLSATLPTVASSHAVAASRSLPIAGPPPAAPAPATQLRIETALQLVVVEFRSADGEMRQSIPTPREIDAYRNPPLPSPDPKLDVTG